MEFFWRGRANNKFWGQLLKLSCMS